MLEKLLEKYFKNSQENEERKIVNVVIEQWLKERLRNEKNVPYI